MEQFIEDLNNIKEVCNNLIGIAEHVQDKNRAYGVLLILKQRFEEELKQIENGELLPF